MYRDTYIGAGKGLGAVEAALAHLAHHTHTHTRQVSLEAMASCSTCYEGVYLDALEVGAGGAAGHVGAGGQVTATGAHAVEHQGRPVVGVVGAAAVRGALHTRVRALHACHTRKPTTLSSAHDESSCLRVEPWGVCVCSPQMGPTRMQSAVLHLPQGCTRAWHAVMSQHSLHPGLSHDLATCAQHTHTHTTVRTCPRQLPS